MLIEPEHKDKKDLQQAVCDMNGISSAKYKTKNSESGTAMGAKCSLDGPIPCKTLGGQPNKKQCKLCHNCAKHSPKIKHTHNTNK